MNGDGVGVRPRKKSGSRREPLYHHKYFGLGLWSPAKWYLKVSSKSVSNLSVAERLLFSGSELRRNTN